MASCTLDVCLLVPLLQGLGSVSPVCEVKPEREFGMKGQIDVFHLQIKQYIMEVK